MKRLICVILALGLFCTCAFAEMGICDLYDEAVKLAFNTSNVTLAAEAEFRLDGELFKTMHATYKQDSFNSYLYYMLDTVKPDGSLYTGGFEVVGINSDVYASDTYFGNYYYMSTQAPVNTVLTASAQTNAMLGVGRTLAAVAAPLETVNAKMSEDGMTYHYSVSDLPEFVDSTVFYLIRDYMFNNYYRYLFNEKYSNDYAIVYYEDWDAVISNLYFRLFNEEMPEDISNENDENRYALAYNWAEQLENEVRCAYTDGYVLIRADGSNEWYATEEECMRASGYVSITFRDEYAALSSYYELTYGEPLSRDVWTVMMYTPNSDLFGVYCKLCNDTYEYYKEKAKEIYPEAVYVVVGTDGSLKEAANDYYGTVTSQVLGETQYAELKNLDADVIVDDSCRLTGFKGTVEFLLTYVDGSEHVLSVVFDTTAADYDTTHVNDVFDASEYGWVTQAEYFAAQEAEGGYASDWEEFVQNAPDTVVIMGNTYETLMSTYR